MTPEKISHYQVIKKLGAGGMGQVYLAEDTRLYRKVAVKVLPAEMTQSEDRLRRFEQEARAAAALSHPNIAHVYEVGESNGTHFIAMEFVDGDTLTSRIHGNKSDLNLFLKYLLQVAEGLAKAHSSGIVHRDLKPDNIMISQDGYAKILDFGLAKLIESPGSAGPVDSSEDAATAMMPATPMSVAGAVMGTIGYMSPEQAQGKVIDQRSDIFSFGCILFEAVTQRRPFDGESAIDTLHKIVYAQAPSISDFNSIAPNELQRIVRRCLAKEPDKRYQTIRDVANELEEVCRDSAALSKMTGSAAIVQSIAPAGSVAPVSTSGITPSAGFSTRRKTIGIVGAVVVAALLCVGFYGFYRYTSRTNDATKHFQNIRLARLTTDGNVVSVVVSPEGKYVAYSLLENGKLSLWTKHLATNSRVQIVPPSDAGLMFASSFTNDGSYLYYIVRDEQNPQAALYLVPVLGGTPKKLITDINTPVTFSPDGRQLAFGRYDAGKAEFSLVAANADGSGERTIVSRRRPEWFAQNGASWSPDGRLIAFGYGSSEGGEQGTIAVASLADGELKVVTPYRFGFVGRIAWLNDGKGLILVAREQGLGNSQIWHVSYPSGEVRRVTNDLNSYSPASLTLTADSTQLITVQSAITANIWILPNGETKESRQITSRKNVQDGTNGLSWSSEGKIIYNSDVTGKQSIWSVDSDGSNQKQLIESGAGDGGAGLTPDGRYLIFFSSRSGISQIWRSDSDGSNRKQLTEENGINSSSLSPDGRFVIFTPVEGGIKKVSIDGGPAITISDNSRATYAQQSPDGKLLAYFLTDDHTHKPNITVIPSEGGPPITRFEIPVTASLAFGWSPFSNAMIFINTVGGVSNLWSQSLAGGSAKQITDFKSDLIYNFAFSPDGKQLAISRGDQSRDAVMISEVK